MLEELYEQYKEDFSKSDFMIMECLLRNQKSIPYYTTQKLVETLNISSSTVSRFWSKIGFKNINDFKNCVHLNNASTPSSRTSSTKEQLLSNPTAKDLAHRIEHNILQTLERLTDQNINDAVSFMMNAQKIYIYAPDASIGIAEILSYRCRRLNIQLITIPGGSEVYETMVNITDKDLVIMFSYSRILSEIYILLQHCKNISCKSILFTDLLASAELSMADLVLYSYRGEPNDYHSMVAPMTVIDMIIMKLIEQTTDSIEKAKKLEELRERYSGIIKR